MDGYCITLRAASGFATPLRGDTLFGQCCWQLRYQLGESALASLLEGYVESAPFLVISDPFPVGHLPRPSAPAVELGFAPGDPASRKRDRAKRWLPSGLADLPLGDWAEAMVTDDVAIGSGRGIAQRDRRYHNSIDRLTGTTGSGGDGFAPFTRELLWYDRAAGLQLHVLLDTDRLAATDFEACLAAVGLAGYGKEASTGAGRFELMSMEAANLPLGGSHALALAPCKPVAGLHVEAGSYYRVHTRFGRHGDALVHSGQPFKNPVLLADTGALLQWQTPSGDRPFVGNGITGVSQALPATVHQGYAPVCGVSLEGN